MVHDATDRLQAAVGHRTQGGMPATVVTQLVSNHRAELLHGEADARIVQVAGYSYTQRAQVAGQVGDERGVA